MLWKKLTLPDKSLVLTVTTMAPSAIKANTDANSGAFDFSLISLPCKVIDNKTHNDNGPHRSLFDKKNKSKLFSFLLIAVNSYLLSKS